MVSKKAVKAKFTGSINFNRTHSDYTLIDKITHDRAIGILDEEATNVSSSSFPDKYLFVVHNSHGFDAYVETGNHALAHEGHGLDITIYAEDQSQLDRATQHLT